jgi:hypothetical protein
MLKQIEIHGQRFELYSPDDGRTWSSSPQAIVAYGRRKEKLRLDLQKRFERIDARGHRAANILTGLESAAESQQGDGDKVMNEAD